MPDAKDVTKTKDVGTIVVDTERGGNDAETTLKSPGDYPGVPLIYRKEQCLAWAAQVHQGTMAHDLTVIQSAQAYYEWLIND